MNTTIYLVVIIIVVLVVISFYNRIEGFSNPNKLLTLDEFFIENILPVIDPKDTGYIITAINPNKNEFNPNHLYKVYSLKNLNKKDQDETTQHHNNYKPLVNGTIDASTLIVHLLWSHDSLDETYTSVGKKLMCVGLKHVNKKPVYTIYIKETNDIESKWTEFEHQHNDKSIKSIIYDLNDNLLGIDARDNQIYQLNESSLLWNGPINYDSNINLHKLIFNADKILIAIDVYGKIHKHNSIDWKNTPWVRLVELNKNNTKLSSEILPDHIFYDLIYDSDGKFIALAKNQERDSNTVTSLLKQYVHESKFVDYFNDEKVNKVVAKEDVILSKNDIIMYKTGIDTNKFDYLTLDDETRLGHTDKTELKRKTVAMINLNHYLKIKRTLLQKCKNFRNSFSTTKLKKHTINANISIYNTIETIIQDLDTKYDH